MKLLTVRFIKIFAALFIFGFINATATAQQTDTTWTAIGHPDKRLNALIGSGTKLIAGNNDGIFVSADDGQSWTARMVDSIEKCIVKDIHICYKQENMFQSKT